MKKQFLSLLALSSILLSLVPGFSVGLAQTTSDSGQASTTIFNDVDSTNEYSEAIKYLKDQKIVQGYANGNYEPDQKINRAEFVKILIGSKYENLSGKNCFPDVRDQWFASYICKAAELKVVAGYPDGNFKPEQNITFAEAAKIIVKTYALGTSLEGNSDTWFEGFIRGLEAENDIPLSVEYFNQEINRAEMAEMIYRLRAKIKDRASRTYDEIQGDEPYTVKTCQDLEERYLDFVNRQQPPIYYYKDAMPVMEAPSAAPGRATTSPADSAGATSGGGGAADYSHTNLQVAGVDEGDIVKNDGRYIYVLKGNSVRIVDAYPASNLKELVKFEFTNSDANFYPTDLYVDGNTMVVLGSTNYYYTYAADEKMMAPGFAPTNTSRVKTFVLDITNRTQPKVTRSSEFEGYLNTSRKVGNTLYLVMNYSQYYPIPYYGIYRPQTQNFGLYLPKMKDSVNGADEQIVPCDQVHILPHTKNFNYLITAAVPLTDNSKKVARSVAIGSTDNVYSSAKNLYVAATDWAGPYWEENSSPKTKLFKFALTPGSINFAASGQVPGTVLNQFSMDEDGDTFRIATTEDAYSGEPTNGVYVLDSALKTLGKVTGLAEGERLYSARFMGKRAYLVTFRQVDPLFVIDLQDSRNPRKLGELKIPGYSNYLEPYDENHLIGFGQDVDVVDESESITGSAIHGMKMALFDVTDMSKPKQMFTEIIGDQGTYSEVFYNHKALLFDKSKNLLAFPVSVTAMPTDSAQCGSFTYSSCPSSCTKQCKPTNCSTENGVTVCTTDCDGKGSCQQAYAYPKTVFVGAYVYDLTLSGGFKLKSKITHLNAEEINELLKNGWLNDYNKTVQRVLYIGDSLYTVSQAMVKANGLSDYAEKGSTTLADTTYDYYGKPMPVDTPPMQ